MRVTIKDRDFLKRITPQLLEDYLDKNNFKYHAVKVEDDVEIGNIYSVYSKELHTEVFVEVLNDETRIDYIASITTALMYLEKAMDQSQLQIFVDITGDEVFFIPKDTEDQIKNYIKDIMA